MNPTPEQERQIRLLSDGALYAEAVVFVQQHRPPDAAQINGLLTYSQHFSELDRFVKHQIERQWVGNRGHYQEFYERLSEKLKALKQQAVGFVPEGLTKRQTQTATEDFATRLSQDFVQHLVAEALLVLAEQHVQRGQREA